VHKRPTRLTARMAHCQTALMWTSYCGQPAASNSRFIWHKTQAPQQYVTRQSLHTEPRIPSMSRTLVRRVMMPPGTKHGTQQCSPMRFDRLEAQHSGHNATNTQFLQSSVQPRTPVFQSLFPVVTCVVPPELVTWRVTTVVVVCDILTQ
jgi:hypothetical protein